MGSEEIVTHSNDLLSSSNKLKTYVPPDKIVMENNTGAVVRKGADYFCLTEEQLNKVQILKEIQEILPGKETFDCGEGDEDLHVINWEEYGLEARVPWETTKKALFYLTKIPVIGASKWDLPKPMTGPFKDMTIADKSEDESEKTDNKEKWKQIEVPAAIKSFFAFQVNTTPSAEDAAKAIEQGNATYKERVAGEFGSLFLTNLGRDDEYLNQREQNTHDFDRENKVNNPRELVKLIEGSSELNYQELLNFAAAKLASGIRVNDLYRLRALFGFSASGDYTDETYLVQRENKIDPEEVVGYQALLRNHKWFDPNEDKNAVYFANKDKKLTVDRDYLPENITYAKIDDAAEMKKILARDYPTGWTEAWDVNKKLICKKEPANQFVEQY